MVRDIDEPQNILMIGVSGAGMAPLAIYLSEIGFNVYGWDDFPDLNVKDMLIRHRVVFMPDTELPHRCDCVVVSSAANIEANEACVHAKKLSRNIFRRGEFLAEIIRHKKLLAVVGSHGKTSVCARISQILTASSRYFDYIVGGFFKDDSVAPAKYHPCSEWIVAEIDESDGTIGSFSPEITVALNYDDDHIVNYRDSNGLKSAFRNLFARTKSKVYVTADHGVFRQMAPEVSEKYSILEGLPKENFVGRNNQISDRIAKDVFGVTRGSNYKFSGVKRRNDLMCKIGNITFVQDYAHHPTEVEAILTYARSHYPHNRITVVFQPHRASRTSQYFRKFANVLQKFDSIILVEVYCAFEERLEGISSKLIYDILKNDHRLFVRNINDLGNELGISCASLEGNEDHLILFACAGDLLKYAQLFVSEYRANVISNELGEDICSKNVPLKAKTSFGCSATARTFIEPRSDEDLVKVLHTCEDLNLDYTLLAGGSNVIFPEGIYGKAVVKLSGEYWQQIEFLSEEYLRASAGAKLSDVHRAAHERGFKCFEFLECIPETVGGAVVMNVGAHGHSISEFVSKVHGLGSSGITKIFSNEDCKFGYRSSNFSPKAVITCVELQLRRIADADGSWREIRARTLTFKDSSDIMKAYAWQQKE